MASGFAVAVFADLGETRYRALYRQAGGVIAARGGTLIVLPRAGQYAHHLVEGTLAGGGRAVLVGHPRDLPTLAPEGATIEKLEPDAGARAHAGAMADAFVGLPGKLDPTAELYRTWLAAGGAASGKPIGFVNRKHAFEVVRGFVHDVLAVGKPGADRSVQFADNFEDLWSRLSRVVEG
jgi:hypothetical protein